MSQLTVEYGFATGPRLEALTSEARHTLKTRTREGADDLSALLKRPWYSCFFPRSEAPANIGVLIDYLGFGVTRFKVQQFVPNMHGHPAYLWHQDGVSRVAVLTLEGTRTVNIRGPHGTTTLTVGPGDLYWHPDLPHEVPPLTNRCLSIVVHETGRP